MSRLPPELSVERPGFVCLITLCEIARVLADCYGADKLRVLLDNGCERIATFDKAAAKLAGFELSRNATSATPDKR